ncbi:YjeF N-terminal domain-containing protein [Cladochytrium replicatum]|nr:YjeF N-terminal domain-containing protein [Cladochytrium replicatum]
MAEQFLDLDVAVDLANGEKFFGKVQRIDQQSQNLTLMTANGPVVFPAHAIVDLQILPTLLAPPSQLPPSQFPDQNVQILDPAIVNQGRPIAFAPIHQSEAVSSRPTPLAFHDPAIVSFSFAPVTAPQHSPGLLSLPSATAGPSNGTSHTLEVSPSKRAEGKRNRMKSVEKQQRVSPRKSGATELNAIKESSPRRGGNRQSYNEHDLQNSGNGTTNERSSHSREGWRDDDVTEYQDDFDFQASLGRFDKKKVFQQIRDEDSQDPETLLVSLNVRQQRPGFSGKAQARNHSAYLQQKLGVRENVLDETGNDADVGFSDVDSVLVKNVAPVKTNSGTSIEGDRRRPLFRTTAGVLIPSITVEEMNEIERNAAIETGPNDEQMVENGGRAAASMVMRFLGGPRRLRPDNHNSQPSIMVLAGNNKAGAYGLCAARHLANRGITVSAFLLERDPTALANTVAYQLKMFVASGGKRCKSFNEVSVATQYDIIVDSLLGSHQTFDDLSADRKSLAFQLIAWANGDGRSSIFSLDLPSGLSGSTGLPIVSPHYIIPRWTITFGLPKIGLQFAQNTGQLFLADISIPRILYSKLLSLPARYISPFYEKFVIPIMIADTF